MANNKREQAKTLAAAGASAQKIQRQTGVSSTAASKFASQAAAPANSMKINYQDVINNPGKYDAGYSKEVASQNPDSVIYKGLYGGGLNAGGTNDFYKLQGYQVPGATNGIGPDGSVLFMADPGNGRGQEWLNENFGPGGRYYGGARAGSTAAATPGSPSAATDAASTAGGRMKLNDAGSIKQALRVAGGGNGNVSYKELMQIGKQFNAGDDKVVRRLDAVNSNRLKNKKASIGLGSNAYNKLTSRGMMGNMFANYGDGYLGQAVTKGMPQMYGGKNSGGTSGITDPLRVRKGLTVTGLSAKGDVDTREKFLLKGMFDRPQTKAATTTETTPTTTPTTNIPGPVGAEQTAPSGPLQQDFANAGAMGPGGLYGGGLGGPGASRLRRARTRQQRLGIRGAGTSVNNRTSPFFNSLN
jgi:hypothetical protein